jgi:hypothetical protein
VWRTHGDAGNIVKLWADFSRLSVRVERSIDLRNQRRKGHSTDMTNVQATPAATVAEQGAPAAPVKASSKKQATAKKVAPKAQQSAKRAKPKNDTNKTAKTAKPQAGPRTGTKGAKVLALLARTNGASLTELMKSTKWQAHSIRGFLSTASRKHRVTIESFKNDKGERIYRVKK